MRLDYETRIYLRQAISDHKKSRLAQARRTDPYLYCLRCGTEKGNYTPGCTACNDRKRRNSKTVPCHDCGAPINQNTLRRRVQHGWPSANIQKCRACLHARCTGCDGPVGQFTSGCDTCRYRHHKRLLEQRKREAA